jgi:hypothetical protein
VTPTAPHPRPELPAHCDPARRWLDVLPERDGHRLALEWFPFLDGHNPTAGIVRIDGPKDSTRYTVCEGASLYPGREFVMAKYESKPGAVTGTDKSAEWYCCFVAERGAESDNCQCKGWQRWRHCRHLDSLRALIGNSWL